MFYNFGPILYHVLTVLFPILFYHLFLNEDQEKRHHLFSKFTLINLITLVLTMSSSLVYKSGYHYDYREIPLMVSILYGGLMPGSITLIFMLIYRFMMGGGGFYVTIISYSIATFLTIIVLPKYRSSKLREKIIIISILHWIITFIKVLILWKQKQADMIPFMVIFFLILWFILKIVVFVIENLDKQIILQKELQRAEKLNVISQLAASVAHEVRNPMTSVRGFLQLMGDASNLTEPQKKYIEISLNELEHAQSIINDYLSLAKPNDKGQTVIDLTKEIKSTLELMTSYTNIQNILIESDIQDSLEIKGNKDEVKQVLVNIIKNGIESMEKGGKIIVNAFKTDQSIMIEIIDSGKGITKQQLKYLGTPFYSTKEKGTGVGLTVCYQIIQSMKGKIMVESELGIGTKFTIQFLC